MSTLSHVLIVCVLTGLFSGGLHAEEDKAALAQQAQAILKAACYRCHGQEGATEGGFNYVLDRQRLVAAKKIVPGAVEQSKLLKRITKGDMPPEDEKPRPTPAEIATLQKWIEAGAPDFNPAPAKRETISTIAMVEMIGVDLEKAGERDRRFLRYFTITHLYNCGWSDEELASYRMALSKLVNSLSWGRRVVTPTPIDPARTILRIDLRDYKWSEKIWARLIETYPYGMDIRTPASKYCCDTTSCALPYLRADWFVAAASRPPLYDEVLQLPATDRELERQLHIDVEENIRQERVHRAGFNGSGVSRNNRLIERHETAYGAYWKSYDFEASTGRQNLFDYPLGPAGDRTFDHSGGEIIFTLPNGLQGYMLVDARGNRIEKGPTSVVSDPKQADRAVVNGLSCMSCHARGIIEKADQVREIVQKNPKAFEKKDADAILALYPTQKAMDRLMKEDAERFAKAVAATGCRVDAAGKIVGSDPVVNLALLFERELDLPLAAAEVGVKVEVLVKAMDRSPALARVLGVLKVEGGTIQRQVFVQVFGDLVQELRIGVTLSARDVVRDNPAVPSGPLKPGERLFGRSSIVYLADLPEFDVQPGEWPFAKDGTIGNNEKTRIKVQGYLSPKGLGMHPPWGGKYASVKYRLGKQAALFKAVVAINDSTNWCFSPAIFEVWGDGKRLFESKETSHTHLRSYDCSVDVSGVDVLELRVRVINGNKGVHAVWIEPRLLQRADNKDIRWPPVNLLFEKGSREFLTDLAAIDTKPGPWPLGRDGETGDPQGRPIMVNGKRFPKGIGLHPPHNDYSAVRYRLGKKAALFKGAVAINDDGNGTFGGAVFEIHADGKVLWRSTSIRERAKPQAFSLKLDGVDILELRVVAQGPNHGLHAVWLDPRVLRQADTPDDTADMVKPSPSGAASPAENVPEGMQLLTVAGGRAKVLAPKGPHTGQASMDRTVNGVKITGSMVQTGGETSAFALAAFDAPKDGRRRSVEEQLNLFRDGMLQRISGTLTGEKRITFGERKHPGREFAGDFLYEGKAARFHCRLYHFGDIFICLLAIGDASVDLSEELAEFHKSFKWEP
jgi:mono/diheme cytochrome c family protein